MRVFVMTVSGVDYSDVVAVVTTAAAALAVVRERHKQRSLKIEANANGIMARWRGGSEYYDCAPFDVRAPQTDTK